MGFNWEVEQPTGGNWLGPKNRMGHLIAFIDVDSKEAKYDKLSDKNKDVASFRFVDLDAECDLISGLDNHPGITNKLRVGNPKVVLGRIGTVPSAQGQDAFVLAEHDPARDMPRFEQWAIKWQTGQATTTTTPEPQPAPPHPAPPQPAPTPVPQPAPVPAPAPQPSEPQPTTAVAGQLDFSKLDAATLALIQQQLNGATAPAAAGV